MSETQKPNQGNREGGNRRPRRNNSNNNNNNRNRNNRNRNRSNQPPKPLELTFWQKLLKAVGLFDEEKVRKQQRDQQRSKKPAQQKTTAPKSNVRNAKTSEDKPQRRKPQPVAVESARLYVGNLSYDATEYDLEELFKGVGTVKKVEIIYNRNTHKSKGYGFIQMLNKEEAERAVEVLHDQPFMGRQLVVNGSKSRKEGDTSGEENQANSAE
ncbi:RNA recognition motif domain-containing protein [Rubritalea sp.]|uniref:RNA recognition motif domain-containing protein n=1 Tax=Rubritalea sp. TaxID=2109375 RepID=UPI003EF781BE